MSIAILDRLSPGESHLPPSRRTWARIVDLQTVPTTVLELRDPNDGQDPDPASKARHQYAVARGLLWRRRLPPAPLDEPCDETPWADAPVIAGRRQPPAWEPIDCPRSPIGEWARAQGAALVLPGVQPLRVERDIHGDGGGEYDAYRMPPAHPWDHWADITGVPCPVPGCEQTLVWYEAGYVPGYRVCMAHAADDDGYDLETLRHHFCLDHQDDGGDVRVLIRDHDRG